MAPINATIRVFVVFHKSREQTSGTASSEFTTGTTESAVSEGSGVVSFDMTSNGIAINATGYMAGLAENSTYYAEPVNTTIPTRNETILDWNSTYSEDSTIKEGISTDYNKTPADFNLTYGESPLVRYSYEFSLFTFFVIILGVLFNLVFIKFFRSTGVQLNIRGGLWYSMTLCNLLLSGVVFVILFLTLSREEWPLDMVFCKAYISSLLALTAYSNNCSAIMTLER